MSKADRQKAVLDPEFALHLLKSNQVNTEEWSEEELEMLSIVLEELRNSGDSKILSQLREIDFWRNPPSIEEFLESETFLGNICQADPVNGSTGLFPKWRECLYRDFAETATTHQLVLTGGIGLGKTFVGCIAILYKIAFALCLRNPLSYYRLAKSTRLTYSFFSVTQKQVKGGAFQDAIQMMRGSPFFAERVIDNIASRKFADRRIELAGNIVVEAGSQAHEALGRNTLCSLIDEINFRREKEAAVAAEELINAITRRLKSRFMTSADKNPGLLVIISSANNETDFLNAHIQTNRKDPTVKIYDFPWWEVAGPVKMKDGYCGETFPVDIGDQTIPPKICHTPEEVQAGGHRVIQVPVEHRKEFVDDLDGAIRDIAGKSTGRRASFFGNIVPLLNIMKSGMKNPMFTETIKLSTSSLHEIQASVNMQELLQIRGSVQVPRRHSMAPRFIHLDMSSGAEDAMGFAMVHPIGLTNVGEFDRISGRRHELAKPVFELDMAFRIVRDDQTLPIDLGKVRQFIFWLSQMKFKIEKVTADLLNMSSETLSILKQLGFETGYLSMDRKPSQAGKMGPSGGYYILRQCISEKRFIAHRMNWLMLELINLEDHNGQIDHPVKWKTRWPDPTSPSGYFDPGTDRASKDVADAVGGAIANAEQSSELYSNLFSGTIVDVLSAASLQPNPLIPEVKAGDIMTM